MEIIRRWFLTATLCVLVLLPVGVLSYRHLFHGRIVPVLIAAVLLSLYAAASAASAHGIMKMQNYEQIYHARGFLEEDHPKLLLYAMLIPLPLHFCTLLASLIPITTWEVWFVTVFPCIFLTFQPIRAVGDVYDLYTRRKRIFWMLQLLTVFTITVSMQAVVQTFL